MRNKVRISLLLSVLSAAGVFCMPVQSSAQATSESVCADFSKLSGWYGPGGFTSRGIPLPVGAVITVTATFGSANTTFGTFDIEKFVNGVVLAGPASVPATLTYTVTSADSTALIGFRVIQAHADFCINGICEPIDGQLRIAASCTMPAVAAPALSPLGWLACGLLLVGVAGAVARRKAQSSRWR